MVDQSIRNANAMVGEGGLSEAAPQSPTRSYAVANGHRTPSPSANGTPDPHDDKGMDGNHCWGKSSSPLVAGTSNSGSMAGPSCPKSMSSATTASTTSEVGDSVADPQAVQGAANGAGLLKASPSCMSSQNGGDAGTASSSETGDDDVVIGSEADPRGSSSSSSPHSGLSDGGHSSGGGSVSSYHSHPQNGGHNMALGYVRGGRRGGRWPRRGGAAPGWGEGRGHGGTYGNYMSTGGGYSNGGHPPQGYFMSMNQHAAAVHGAAAGLASTAMGYFHYQQQIMPTPLGLTVRANLMKMNAQEAREYLAAMAVQQIEYYFSVDNLCRDMYLRGYFDEDGWVPLAFVCNFPTVASFAADYHEIINTLKDSLLLDYDDENETIRLKEGARSWLLPKPSGGLGAPRWLKAKRFGYGYDHGYLPPNAPQSYPAYHNHHRMLPAAPPAGDSPVNMSSAYKGGHAGSRQSRGMYHGHDGGEYSHTQQSFNYNSNQRRSAQYPSPPSPSDTTPQNAAPAAGGADAAAHNVEGEEDEEKEAPSASEVQNGIANASLAGEGEDKDKAKEAIATASN